ncbi:MAG: hypothetical protein PF518_17690 [Spirochaetaceae bacterium]|jgi:hypothetical protein|nr:hypothetical protein [Spirochaetaceae bacterium]
MTIDTLFGKRFYSLIILKLKSRRIVKYDFTESSRKHARAANIIYDQGATWEIVRQRIIDFSYDSPEKSYLIHDNAAQFTTIDFNQYGIKAVNASPDAPKAGRKPSARPCVLV